VLCHVSYTGLLYLDIAGSCNFDFQIATSWFCSRVSMLVRCAWPEQVKEGIGNVSTRASKLYVNINRNSVWRFGI